MDTLSALFSGLWDRLNGAAWFQSVQWPFWAFLILIAIGGVYTARIRKNTLFCRGITGALKLALIYLVVVCLYKLIPSYMTTVSQYPFLSMSESALTLVNPLKIFDRPLGTIAELFVRLYFLLFLVNTCGSFDYSGKNPLSWAGSQLLSCSIAVGLYELITLTVAKILTKMHFSSGIYHIVIAVLLLAPLALMLLMKLYFVVFRKAGNQVYGGLTKFLTGMKFGTLFSVTFFSELCVLVVLTMVNIGGLGRLPLSGFSWVVWLLIGAMCTGTLYVFSLYYTERTA